jgi:hypothetical protein
MNYYTTLADITRLLESSETVKAIEAWYESYHSIPVEKFLECTPTHEHKALVESIDEKLRMLNSAKNLITVHLQLKSDETVCHQTTT